MNFYPEFILLKVTYSNFDGTFVHIAHKLDADEDIDFLSNSSKQKLNDLELQILLFKSEKEKLLEQVKKSQIELETKSKQFQLALDELQQENHLLQERVNTQLIIPNVYPEEIVTESIPEIFEIVTELNDHTQLDLLNIQINEKTMGLKPLTGVELSKRFGKSKGFVKGLKFGCKDKLEKLSEILRRHDPQGIAWKFSDVDQKYHPII